jgi:hypothetical protein
MTRLSRAFLSVTVLWFLFGSCAAAVRRSIEVRLLSGRADMVTGDGRKDLVGPQSSPNG